MVYRPFVDLQEFLVCLHANPVLVFMFVSIFSQSFTRFVDLSVVSFNKQKNLILMKSNLSIFHFSLV